MPGCERRKCSAAAVLNYALMIYIVYLKAQNQVEGMLVSNSAFLFFGPTYNLKSVWGLTFLDHLQFYSEKNLLDQSIHLRKSF